MLSRGMDTARALSMAYRSFRLVSGSPPPARAAMMMYRLSLLNSLARAASCLPLRTAMFAEWECPAMSPPRPGGGCDPPGVSSIYSREGGVGKPTDGRPWAFDVLFH